MHKLKVVKIIGAGDSSVYQKSGSSKENGNDFKLKILYVILQ